MSRGVSETSISFFMLNSCLSVFCWSLAFLPSMQKIFMTSIEAQNIVKYPSVFQHGSLKDLSPLVIGGKG